MVDTHKCLNCGETMTKEQANSVTGCPHCYSSKKMIVERSPNDVGEVHQERIVMAAKAVKPKKAAEVATKSAPVKKAEVKAETKKPVVEKKPEPVAPAAKKAGKKVPEKAPEPEKVPETKPGKKALVDGAKTGKKMDAKDYAAKVKADNEALAAKKTAPASPIALTEDDKKREAIRLEKLEKKRKFLNDFTANGAPVLAADADEDAKALWEHNVAAYNEFVNKTRGEIDALSIPVTSQSPAAHIVKFGKDGVAKKLTPEEGAAALAKTMKKEAAQQKIKPTITCVCKGCKHIPEAKLCERCDGNTQKCKQTKGSCKIKEKKGRSVCIQSAIDQGFDTAFIAALKRDYDIK